ncbi:hypothetical protein COCOBI_04-7370 [Coccomyxa sp. Obi]|nr:hypothetical protein COCOBI_04-7370 [Coccomyxa sp. Obi]
MGGDGLRTLDEVPIKNQNHALSAKVGDQNILGLRKAEESTQLPALIDPTDFSTDPVHLALCNLHKDNS